MFRGWATLGGTELWNSSRTFAYAKELAPGFTLLDCADCETLPLALGDDEYRIPILDEPSWFDPDNPDTYNFAGFYPLSVSGVENSNREVEVLQSIRDGGVIGPTRLSTKDVLVRGILVAGDPCSLQAGIDWFKHVLNGNPCTDNCEGDNLCFFYCCPDVAEGVVDPNSVAVPHEISLAQYQWTVDSGRWRNGEWTPTQAPATAIGPVFEPPCDEVIAVAKFNIVEDQSIIFNAIGQDNEVITTTEEVVLRRTNYVRNPSFYAGSQSWTPVAGSTITKDPDMNAGIWEANSSISDDTQILTFLGGNQVFTGQTFSGRVTVELLPKETDSVTNLITNPRAEDSEYGWISLSNPSLYVGGLDSDQSFIGSTSFKCESVNENNNGGLGLVAIGGDGTVDGSYTPVTENTDYYITTMLRSTVQTNILWGVNFVDQNDDIIGDQGINHQPALNTWEKLEMQVTTPPGTVKVSLFAFAFEVGVAVQAGDAMWLDAAMIVQSSTPVNYFDGYTDNAVWNGTPNQSTSTLSLSQEDICLSLDLGTSAGGVITPVEGNEYQLNIGDSVEMEITDVEFQNAGQLVGIIRACGEVQQGLRVRLSEAIITETEEQVPYFDGTTELEGYTTYWTGGFSNSFSRMELENGELDLTIFNGSGPFRLEFIALENTTLHVEEITVWARETIEPSECAERNYVRTLRDVVVTSGPTILRKVEECDHSIAEVEFTITAANPYVWHILPFEFDLVDDSNPQPLPPGGLRPARWPPVTHFPPGQVPAEDDCPNDSSETLPLADPNCPLPPAPPRPPKPDDCLEEVSVYYRRAIGINGELFSQWQEAVPIVELEVKSSVAVRQARVRFYPNPLERDSLTDIDLCGYCGEFIISYIPGNSRIIIDGMTERARVEMPGDVTKEATHLLYGSDGGPMKWPTLTCGTPYIMSVDVAPINADVVTADMTLAVRG